MCLPQGAHQSWSCLISRGHFRNYVYVLNTEGMVPAHDEDDPKYAAIGKDLIDRGLAEITERGLLIRNPLDELCEVYDRQTFPEYYYRADYLVAVRAEYNGRRIVISCWNLTNDCGVSTVFLRLFYCFIQYNFPIDKF